MSVKVGDKIRVKYTYPDTPYKAGDIFEVSETYANSRAVGVKEGYYVGGGMFEIITEEEKRMSKAQVGDLIRIVNADDTRYSNGDIFEVTDIEIGGAYVETPVDSCVFVFDSEYVIHRKAGEEGSEISTDVDDLLGEHYSDMAEEMTQDAVNPYHYKQGRVEVIDIIEDAVQGADPFEAVCQANIIKYTLRYRAKNGVEDLRKSVWYTNRLIDYLDAKSTQ